MNFKEIREVISKVKDAKGKAKVELLNFHRAVPDLPRFIHAVYDPSFNYFIDKYDFEKELNESRTRMMGGYTVNLTENAARVPLTRDVFQLAQVLATRQLTGRAARNYLADCMVMMDEDEAALARMLINRSLGCGVAEKGFNNVWPDLIYVVPYLRCSLPKDSNYSEFEWSEGVYSQVKADGSFANLKAYPNGSSVETRAGTTYGKVGPLAEIHQALNQIAFVHGAVVIHGETVVYRGNATEPLPREEGNGILNKLIATGDIPPEYRVEAQVWDIVRRSEYENGRCERPYEERFNQLQLITADLEQQGVKSIKLIEGEVVYSEEEANAHYKKQRRLGREGTVLKRRSTIWFNGDSKDQVKMKALETVDLRIKGFQQGDRTGKYANTLGSLQCESQDGELEVGVSGMTDAQREEFWNNQFYYTGKIVEVMANGVMLAKNPGEKASLFLPRLFNKGTDVVRLDKTEADTLKKIIAAFEA